MNPEQKKLENNLLFDVGFENEVQYFPGYS